MKRALVRLSLLLPLLPAAALACGDGLPQRAEASGWVIRFAPQPQALPLNRHFALQGQVCPPPGAGPARALRVDADMPAHRHGMNYRARTTLGDDGRFEAQGLLFHMPGRWRLLFDLQTADGPLRLQHEIEMR